MTLSSRLKIIRKELGKTQNEMASLLDVSYGSVQAYESGKSIPGGEVIEALVKLGFNANWLLTGEGAMKRGEAPPLSADRGAVYAAEELGKDYALVPRFEIAASAGGGAVVHSEQIVDHLAFKAEWLKVSLGLSPRNAAVISVIGDSMEPYLADGDLILVDTGINRVSNDAVYVLQYDDTLLVKRIQRKGDGTVIVKSDNPRYEPETFRGEAAERLRVVGRLARRLVR